MCGTSSPGEHMSVLAVYNRYAKWFLDFCISIFPSEKGYF